MTQPRHHSRDHGADRAPGSDWLAICRNAYVKANSIPAEHLEAFPRLGLIRRRRSQATAGQVRQHPSGKSSNAHSNAPSCVPLRQHDDAEGHAKVCGKTE